MWKHIAAFFAVALWMQASLKGHFGAKNNIYEHMSCHQYFWVLSLRWTELWEQRFAFFELNLSFALLRDKSSFFPDNSGGNPCSVIDESFYLLKKKEWHFEKGCHEVSSFHLFEFCSKPKGPIPSISVPIRSTPWEQRLTQKVTLKAMFSYLRETCGWLLLQTDTHRGTGYDPEDVKVPSCFSLTPSSPLLSHPCQQKRLCELQEGSVRLVQSTFFSCVHSACC